MLRKENTRTPRRDFQRKSTRNQGVNSKKAEPQGVNSREKALRPTGMKATKTSTGTPKCDFKSKTPGTPKCDFKKANTGTPHA